MTSSHLAPCNSGNHATDDKNVLNMFIHANVPIFPVTRLIIYRQADNMQIFLTTSILLTLISKIWINWKQAWFLIIFFIHIIIKWSLTW